MIKNDIKEVVHKLSKIILRSSNPRWSTQIFSDQYYNHYSGFENFSRDQEILKQRIDDSMPLFVGRIGSIEMYSFLTYLQIQNRLPQHDTYSLYKYLSDQVLPNWWNRSLKKGLCNNAGFFPYPPSDHLLYKWAELFEQDIKDVDILLRWLTDEDLLLHLNKHMSYMSYRNIETPFLYTNPYIESLRDKTVLIISPFSQSIHKQHQHLQSIWREKKCMAPTYKLKTIQSFNVLRGLRIPKDVSTWFDALEQMKAQISRTEFDIALIGCGAYAFHLGAYIKRIGKKAITTCGATELLFGIYGTRWIPLLQDYNLLNQYWIRPIDDKPLGYEKVENGAYW